MSFRVFLIIHLLPVGFELFQELDFVFTRKTGEVEVMEKLRKMILQRSALSAELRLL